MGRKRKVLCMECGAPVHGTALPRPGTLVICLLCLGTNPKYQKGDSNEKKRYRVAG